MIKKGKSNLVKNKGKAAGGNKYKNISSKGTINGETIILKSKLELFCATEMTNNGIYFEYEPFSIPLSPQIDLCHWEVKKGEIKKKCKHKVMVYTPDFIIPDEKGEWEFVIETKGMISADFPLRMKLFKIWLQKNKPNAKYYICYSQKDVLVMIDHIKQIIRDGIS